jgi:hypothetical protein
MWGNVHRLYANTSFYIRDLSICRFWCPGNKPSWVWRDEYSIKQNNKENKKINKTQQNQPFLLYLAISRYETCLKEGKSGYSKVGYNMTKTVLGKY